MSNLTGEKMMAADAVKKFGIDFKVQEQPVSVGGNLTEAYKGIVREDNGYLLSIMKEGYETINIVDTFQLFDGMVSQDQAEYIGGGQFRGGRKVFLQAKLPNPIRIAGTDDIVNKHLLLATSHDGTIALRALFTPFRVACENTLAKALDSRDGITIRHTRNAKVAIKKAQEALGIAVKYYDDLEPVLNRMAQVQVSAEALKTYYKLLVPDTEGAERHTRTENIRTRLEQLFAEGKGNQMAGVRGSVWAALNGVTEFISHERSARGRNADEKNENRLESVIFGSGSRMSEKAFGLAMRLAGIKE